MKNVKVRIVIILLLGAAFGVLTVIVRHNGILNFENLTYSQIALYINPTLTAIMVIISNTGSFAAITAITALLLILPSTRSDFGFPVALNAIIAAELNILLKAAIARSRPDTLRLIAETGYGFPSGHAMSNAALYTMITLIVFRRTKNEKTRLAVLLLSILLTLSIGISRIYLGVHNAGDVIAGWIMGITVALIVDTLWQASSKRFKSLFTDKEFKN